ncbi:unnamed protein product (macronuclear) [Paramecium tetraurelia]|uniref:Uncharacterized protein n=1 Tax=Paramecium tetraurelia TaxID=5888 RepID=A0BN62_PARTE|nr:uncharacterized protein GSPATT00030617001 [Paramecium tetraurelia]CAK59979.1 unnamed protein product [Paramecium tetraurelia]|eukprot:XP_001427377.1 hypothetical protein (macronuclear) [Paramecium tetraurelia strain d4-2]
MIDKEIPQIKKLQVRKEKYASKFYSIEEKEIEENDKDEQVQESSINQNLSHLKKKIIKEMKSLCILNQLLNQLSNYHYLWDITQLF